MDNGIAESKDLGQYISKDFMEISRQIYLNKLQCLVCSNLYTFKIFGSTDDKRLKLRPELNKNKPKRLTSRDKSS